MDGEESLTGSEAARLLGVKRATLYAYVSRGLIRSYRQSIKRRRLYRRADLETMLQVVPSGRLAGDGDGGAAGCAAIPLAES